MEREKLLRNILVVFTALLAAALIMKMMPKPVWSRNIHMVLVKNRMPITTLTNEKDIDFTWSTRVSSVDFPEGAELAHPDRGPLGYRSDFFIDLSVYLKVKKEGTYIFSVVSDDGFRLSIEGKTIGEVLTNRPFTTNRFNVYVKPGTYLYQLSYFQGFGRLGLYAAYRFTGDNRDFVVGRNTKYIDFIYR